MATQKKTAITTINEFVKTIDFDTLIEIAELAALIPGIGTICAGIINILKVAKKFQPTADKVLTNADQLYGVCANDSDSSTDNEALDKVNTLIEIALEDGIITEEEENFILERAQTLGLDTDEIKLKLLHNKQ